MLILDEVCNKIIYILENIHQIIIYSYNSSIILTSIQVLVTAAIILIPPLTEHHLNPYQKRSRAALERLRAGNDSPIKRMGFEDDEKEKAINSIQESDMVDDELLLGDIINVIEDGHKDVNIGFVERGDKGFRILLDGISRNRTIDKKEVEAIGLLMGPIEMFDEIDNNEAVATSTGVSIGPNAGVFIDYNTGLELERELIIFYKESPSLTVSLHELEI